MKSSLSANIALARESDASAGRSRPGTLRAIWHWAAYIAAFYFFFAAAGLALALLSALLRFTLPRQARQAVGRFVIQKIFHQLIGFMRLAGLMEIDTTELEKLSHQRGVIIAPNHPCLLDALIVMSRLPHAVCIMKAELWNNPVLGGARLAGYIRNDSQTAVIRRSVEALREGGQLLIFPEGTRTMRGPVNKFKGGFALMSRLANAPVQTVFIETNTRAYRKGWPVFRIPEFPMRFTVRLGKKFTADSEDDLMNWVCELEDYYRDELG